MNIRVHYLRRPSREFRAAPSVDRADRRASRRLPEATFADLERVADGELDAAFVAGRYRVERILGHGGMASVYAAHDLVTDRRVAIKVLSEECCTRPPQVTRFLREARLHGRIHHPNVVEVLDFGSTKAGVIYLVMELLEGEDLGRTLARRSTLPWPRARELMLEICAGLGAAHRAGVIHRDLKPSNCFRVLVGGRESIRLVDFGIAVAIDEIGVDRLTLNEQIVGTPEYMSPEQARGERVDRRSDIYAAGLLLGQLLTGSLPFRAGTSSAMLAAQIYEVPPRLGSLLPPAVQVPAAVEPIYQRALAKQPDDRFAEVEELAAALRAIEPGGPLLLSGSYPRVRATPRLACETATVPAQPPRQRPPVRSPWIWAAAVAFALMIGAIGALALASSFSPDRLHTN
ncbi:MAG TPA: serine/threonine-protein kinase [Enhygromyxa sp.]|nr:serine/threonine-protein kinase [Enhygromyxa sp.]